MALHTIQARRIHIKSIFRTCLNQQTEDTPYPKSVNRRPPQSVVKCEIQMLHGILLVSNQVSNIIEKVRIFNCLVAREEVFV